jgi:nucleotide-binding universal stress UspA family protein
MSYRQSILAPVNLTSHCTAGVEWALRHGSETGRDVVALFVAERIGFDVFVRKSEHELLKMADAELQRYVERNNWRDKLSTVVLAGVPSISIAEYANHSDASLIVLQGHNHPWLRHALMASLSRRVAELAPCPLAILHGGTSVEWVHPHPLRAQRLATASESVASAARWN